MHATAGHLALAAAVAAMLLAGCGAPQITGGQARLPEDDGSPGYLDRISALTDVSENDAMRGFLMILDGEETAEDFQQRVEALKQRGIVGANWSFDADRPLTKGRLAYMAYQASGVGGGVILTLTGPSQRYCLRELQYQGIMAQGLPNTQVTGMEFVAVLTRTDTYRRTGELPAVISGRQ